MNGVEGDGVGNWTCRKWMCASVEEFWKKEACYNFEWALNEAMLELHDQAFRISGPAVKYLSLEVYLLEHQLLTGLVSISIS